MENSKPQYVQPVIVDLDDPDKLYAAGACNPLGSGDVGVCKNPGIAPQGGFCKPNGWLARNCSSGTIG
jgi:hypothetical protein